MPDQRRVRFDGPTEDLNSAARGRVRTELGAGATRREFLASHRVVSKVREMDGVRVRCLAAHPCEPGGRPVEPTLEELGYAADGDFRSGVPGSWAPWGATNEESAAVPAGDETTEDVLLSGPARIVQSEYDLSRWTYANGDIVYINRGEEDGVSAGKEYFVLREADVVYHPKSRAFYGLAMQHIGRLKVLCTQARTATAVIEDSCNPIVVGDFIKDFESIPIPLVSEYHPSPAHCAPGSGQTYGTIVYAQDGRIHAAENDVVNIDLGSNDQLQPGDLLTVYRPNSAGKLLPDRVLGDAVVLTVEPTSAAVKIVYSRDAIRPGDEVVLR